MIELRGKLTIQRISGSINVVPTSGSPPLQGKTVFPSHEEQLIKPDGEYYGLSVVTVVAVPRLPIAESSANYQNEFFVGRTIDLTGGVYAEVPEPGDPYYHNRVQYPEIPDDIKNSSPYVVIVLYGDEVRFYASNQPFYVCVDGDYTYLRSQTGAANVRGTFRTEVNQWVVTGASDSRWSLYLDDFIGNETYVIWWSNHDIPNGSPEATDIFFPTSEPTVELPTVEPTHYYYAGLKLPKLPDGASPETYPYRTIFRRADGTIELYAFVSNVYYTAKSTFKPANIQWGGGYAYAKYDPDTDAWTSFSTSGYGSIFDIGADYRTVLWAEKDIPSGSASSASIQYYGSPCVPEPV